MILNTFKEKDTLFSTDIGISLFSFLKKGDVLFFTSSKADDCKTKLTN